MGTGQGWGCQQHYSPPRALCTSSVQAQHLCVPSLKALCCPAKGHGRADTQSCRNRLTLGLGAGSETPGVNSCQQHGDSLDKPKRCLNVLIQYLTHVKYFFTVRVALQGLGLWAGGEQDDGVGENEHISGRLELTTQTMCPWRNLKRNPKITSGIFVKHFTILKPG